MTRFEAGIASFLIAFSYGLPAHASVPKYVAQFQWRDGRKMKLVIREKSHRPVARILAQDGRTLASCSVKPIREGFDLGCASAGFSPLTSHATVFIGERQEAVLRFGTWLTGYEQTVLEVVKR